MFDLKPITAEETRPLRRQILRPHSALKDLIYPLDDHEDSVHLGAFRNEACVGVISMYHEDRNGGVGNGSWRIRGMCVLPELRGKGLGKDLLIACVDHARNHGGKHVWCNARTTALGFYRAVGFEAEGEEFELPGIGAHYFLRKTLPAT